MTVSEWCDNHRTLDTRTSAEAGRWSTDRTPYLREIMDSATLPEVEEITIVKGTQLGLTEMGFNLLGYYADQDPCPCLYLMSTQDATRENVGERVIPMFEKNPYLARHLSDKKSDTNRGYIRLNWNTIFFGWYGSPTALASKPIRIIINDEVDKAPLYSGREANPLKLAKERTKTFWNRKIYNFSTPTTRFGNIWTAYQESDQREFYLPCPHCGAYQTLKWNFIEYPHDAGKDEIVFERLAWYRCASCEGRIDDLHKMPMLRKGVWCPKGCGVDKRGQIHGNMKRTLHRGYWINSIYSPFLTFSAMVYERLDSLKSLDRLQNFVNSWLAEPWEERETSIDKSGLAALERPYTKGIVPKEATVLVAGVDWQKEVMYPQIGAWGPGGKSWRVWVDRVASQDALEELLLRDFPREDGGTMQVRLALIDSGAFTEEVYRFCQRQKTIFRPIKGHDHLDGAPYHMSKVERHQKSGKAKKFGIRLWHVDSSYGKDELARLVSEEEPTYFYPAPMEADYYEQLAAEHKIVIRNKTTGRASTEWVAISVGADNHWLDASVYEYFAAHMIGVANLPDGLRWKPGAAAQAIPIRKKTKRFVTATVTRGGVQGGFRRRR